MSLNIFVFETVLSNIKTITDLQIGQTPHFPYFRANHLAFAVLFVLMFSCSPKPSNIPPPIDTPNSFSQSSGDTLIDRWWESFEDPQLNSLIDTALAYNLNLTAMWYRMQQARSIRKRQSTFLLPEIDAGAQTAISRPQPDFAGGENTQVGVSTNYEIDLWGRIRASIDAEQYRFEASYFDYKTAAITLTADIATAWFQLLNTQKQLQLIDEQIARNKEVINLIENRFEAGQVKGVDVLRQQQLLEQSKSLKVSYEANYELIQNQLAVLLGTSPQNFEVEARDSLPSLPSTPATGLPLELVRRRPDVLREYHFLLAADRDLAVAVCNRFPRLSINLSAQARSNDFTELFNNWAYTLGANLVAPLLYWGRLKAEMDRAEAFKQQQLYEYGQSVLIAFQEVENALINEQRQQKQIDILKKRLDMAQKTSKQLETEFIYGFSQYLDILLAEQQEQQLQRDMLQAVQQQYEIRISLYRALAGDFDMDAPADTDQKTTNNE